MKPQVRRHNPRLPQVGSERPTLSGVQADSSPPLRLTCGHRDRRGDLLVLAQILTLQPPDPAAVLLGARSA
jgi:hypothetical protein